MSHGGCNFVYTFLQSSARLESLNICRKENAVIILRRNTYQNNLSEITIRSNESQINVFSARPNQTNKCTNKDANKIKYIKLRNVMMKQQPFFNILHTMEAVLEKSCKHISFSLNTHDPSTVHLTHRRSSSKGT